MVCRITPDRSFRKATLRPLSKNIELAVLNGAISFRLEKPGFYVLELDDSHNALHIFFNAPNDFPEKAGATFYFGPGKHFANVITLKDNDTVYIDASAIVYGALYGQGVKNVHIFGHGVIDGSSFERIGRPTYMMARTILMPDLGKVKVIPSSTHSNLPISATLRSKTSRSMETQLQTSSASAGRKTSEQPHAWRSNDIPRRRWLACFIGMDRLNTLFQSLILRAG